MHVFRLRDQEDVVRSSVEITGDEREIKWRPCGGGGAKGSESKTQSFGPGGFFFFLSFFLFFFSLSFDFHQRFFLMYFLILS